ncbi:MAG: GDSL-type esterase/lipase family protein, partial [Candidatus Thiodiazotropha sp.]
TVDETSDNTYTTIQSVGHEGREEEEPENDEAIMVNSTNVSLPSPTPEIPERQTRQYSEVLRTSTPRDTTNETPHRPRPAPRRSFQSSVSSSSPKPTARTMSINNSKQILLIGDSLISSVNSKGLAPNVFKHGISGAKVDDILAQIKVYDIKKISHVILYVGGNDASSKTDIEYFEEKLDQVIQYIREANNQCIIILCNTCPRGDTSTIDINDVTQSLAQHHGICLIDLNKAFHDRHGNIIAGYYHTDSIHLSPSGVRRLLGTINQEVTIVSDFDKCAYNRRQGNRPQRQRQQQKQQSHGGQKRNIRNRLKDNNNSEHDSRQLCYKCGESNHNTNKCKHKQQLRCFHCGYLGHKSGRCMQKV